MSLVRGLVALFLVSLAVVAQVTLFPHIAWRGVGPDLVLLVVVAAALVRGPEFAAVLGFTGGLVLDLAPPADHLAGRWVLALVVVGYLAGRLRPTGRPSPTLVVAVAAACSFLATSIFALTGILFDGGAGIGFAQMLEVILVALVWDVLLTPLVVPPLLAIFRRLEPARVSYA